VALGLIFMEEELQLSPAQLARQGLVEMWGAIDADQVAKSKAPMKLDMSKVRMKMGNGSYAVAQGINAPRDPLTNVPIVGPG
jgi:hypothetical protein